MRNLVSISAIALLLISCQRLNGRDGAVSFKFPSPDTHSSSGKVSKASVDFSLVCYMANVTGGIITAKKDSACDVPVGIHTKFQLPGSEAILSVPRGTSYRLDIFAYSRTSASEACPSLNADSVSSLDLRKLFLVGKTEFKVDSPDITVAVTVADPGANVAAQFSMPSTCVSADPVESGGPILVSQGGLRFFRTVDSSDGAIRKSALNSFGLVLGKDGSR